MSRFTPVIVDRSLRAEAIAQRRDRSLRDGAVDHLFHYHSPAQARAWLELHRAYAPLHRDDAYERIYRDLFDEIVPAFAGHDVHVIALGPGGGTKERALLEALARDRKPRYTPIDAALELTLLSADVGREFAAEVQPVAGDLSLLPDLRPWLDERSTSEARIFTAFGISPNFLPSTLFGGLHCTLRAGDVALVSANLAPGGESSEAYLAGCEQILPQYDNPQAKRWLAQVLHEWDLARFLSEPQVEIREMGGVLGFVAFTRWLEDANFEWEGRPFHATQGSELRLFYSLRYTPERFGDALRAGGLSAGPHRSTAEEGVWSVGSLEP